MYMYTTLPIQALYNYTDKCALCGCVVLILKDQFTHDIVSFVFGFSDKLVSHACCSTLTTFITHIHTIYTLCVDR